jgi:hypothetical protein
LATSGLTLLLTFNLPPALHEQIEKLLGPRGYLYKPEDLTLYEYDGGVDKSRPDMVVFPQSTGDVVAIVKLAASDAARALDFRAAPSRERAESLFPSPG